MWKTAKKIWYVKNEREKTDTLSRKCFRSCYWNCRGAKKNTIIIQNLVHGFDILVLRESHRKDETTIQCPGYDCYTCRRKRYKRGFHAWKKCATNTFVLPDIIGGLTVPLVHCMHISHMTAQTTHNSALLQRRFFFFGFTSVENSRRVSKKYTYKTMLWIWSENVYYINFKKSDISQLLYKKAFIKCQIKD